MKLKHLAAIFAFTIFVAFAALYYFAFYEPGPQNTAFSPSLPKNAETGVALALKDQETLVLSWQNLPTSTSRIDIFRAKLACESWSKWKTAEIQDPSSGSVEIKVNENLASGYCLYFEAISKSGEALWSSTPINQIAYLGGGTPPPQGQPNGPGTLNQPPPAPPPLGSPPATPTSTPQSQPTSTPPSQPPSGGETTSTPSQSTPIVPDIVHTENFWVDHVNQKIEIGWQNMPSGTDKIIVSRSATSTGPWTKLFEQQGPFENKPYVIRLLDETINSPQYYKLEAFSSSNAILQTFGPLLLSALNP